MPVGLSRFHNPVTLPNDALIHLRYILRITITRSDCQGVDCDNDWGTNRFNIQTTKAPEGKAPNLVVLVHGCCTDANDVGEWNDLANEIRTSINSEEWEVVVWDWHEYTPKINPNPFMTVYYAARQQGPVLKNAIAIHSSIYRHVHFIGHSAGAKLIHDAARAYISDYFIRQENPFIHVTFLDAYTPNEWDSNGQDSYGSLPIDYPNYYSEHYVDRELIFTDECLSHAFNFDITGWAPDKDDRPGELGHQWPRRWYEKSVQFLFTGYKYGYPLSLESSTMDFDELVNELINYPAGQQCPLSDNGTICIPADCW
jgi:hypothetical protein